MLPRFKPHVGRIFFLKKHKLIPASEDKFAKTRKYYKSLETFGEICLVVDETNTRVRITTINSGKLLWVAKFFLGKESGGDEFKKKDYLESLANKLIDLSTETDYNVDDVKKVLLEAGRTLKSLSTKV